MPTTARAVIVHGDAPGTCTLSEGVYRLVAARYPGRPRRDVDTLGDRLEWLADALARVPEGVTLALRYPADPRVREVITDWGRHVWARSTARRPGRRAPPPTRRRLTFT